MKDHAGASRGRAGIAVLAVLLLAVAMVHIADITRIPDGLFQDEASIGYNAWLVSQTGHDEHGALLPLYFKSFGDYKAPVYVYAVAAAFAVFGPSALVLRCTSAVFFGLFLLAVLLLTRRRGGGAGMMAYAMIAGGCLPWYFTLSRIGFEVISQVAIMGWVVYFQYVAFHDPATRNRQPPAAACGALLGLAVYAYPTGRVTSFLYLGVLLVLLWRQRPRGLLATLAGSFAIVLIPYVIYAFQNADALFARFGNITYLNDRTIGWLTKAGIFASFFVAHFDLTFLLLSGDGNLRHSTGAAGELFVTVYALALFAFAWLVSRPAWGAERFLMSLCAGLLVSPVGAALTYAEIPHALRSAVMGLFFLLLSCEGLRILRDRTGGRGIWVPLVYSVLVVEAGLYLNGYFTAYAAKSRAAFQSGGFAASLARAIAQGPDAVVVTEGARFLCPQFYEVALPNPARIPVRLGPMQPAPGLCLVFRPTERPAIAASPLRAVDLSDDASVVGVRCYPPAGPGPASSRPGGRPQG